MVRQLSRYRVHKVNKDLQGRAVVMAREAAKAKHKSIYGVHPGVAMVQKAIQDLPARTGRSLEQWIKFIKKSGPKTEKERREWLKTEQGLGTNYAWWLAERAEGKGGEDGDLEAYLRAADGYVEQMFAGPKETLRPVYDALIKLGLGMGKDVKACPCQTIVPFYRKHVF